MAKICIDVRCLSGGRRTGVEEYTLNLLQNLFEIDKDNEYVLFFNSAKKSENDFSRILQYENVSLQAFRIPNKLLNFSFWYSGWPKIDKMVGGADVVFMPNLFFGAVSKQAKLIMTVHDLSYERYPEHFSWKRRLWHTFINPKKLCRRADKIIAVSRSSFSDVKNIYKVRPDKIKLIYSASADKFQRIDRNDERLIKTKEKYKLPYRFILYLGTIEPRKNIIGLIQAFNQLQLNAQKEGAEGLLKYYLVIAGSPGWKQDKIFEEVRKSPFRKKIKVINFVKDEDKEYVYNLTSLFVYPSFFEGFGFPPLEAMKCGVPVITSNNSSLPEICGSSAILIDPDKPDEIYRAMREVLADHALREKLIAKGLVQSKSFDWEKTAMETIKIILQ